MSLMDNDRVSISSRNWMKLKERKFWKRFEKKTESVGRVDSMVNNSEHSDICLERPGER